MVPRSVEDFGDYQLIAYLKGAASETELGLKLLLLLTLYLPMSERNVQRERRFARSSSSVEVNENARAHEILNHMSTNAWLNRKLR